MLFPPLGPLKKVDNLPGRWVYLDTRVTDDLFEIPSGPPRKCSGWSQKEMAAEDIAPLVERMKELRSKGLTAPMVVREFVARRIAPLQHHERSMWEYSGPEDRMRLSDSSMPDADLEVVLRTLLGKEDPPKLSIGLIPLYSFLSEPRELIRARMPSFDRWDLLREREVSRKENPH